MSIELRGTEFNRGINLFRGLGRFNLGLALIGFRTTGAIKGFDYRLPADCNAYHVFCERSILNNRVMQRQPFARNSLHAGLQQYFPGIVIVM